VFDALFRFKLTNNSHQSPEFASKKHAEIRFERNYLMPYPISISRGACAMKASSQPWEMPLLLLGNFMRLENNLGDALNI
jgi:hypothetical protein